MTQTQCTETSFVMKSDLPCLKIISSRVLASILIQYLNRKFFTNVCRHIFTTIYGGDNVRVALENHHECTILPSIITVGRGIHISTSTKMIVLPSSLLPHNMYLNNEMPEALTTTAIVTIVYSLASTKLNLFRSRLHLFEWDQIQPTIIALFSHHLRLNITNSIQLCSAVAYIQVQVCSNNGTLAYHPFTQMSSLIRSYRLHVPVLNSIPQSIITGTDDAIEPSTVEVVDSSDHTMSQIPAEPPLALPSPIHSPTPETQDSETMVMLHEDDEQSDTESEDDEYTIPSGNLSHHRSFTRSDYNLRH